MHPNQPPRTRPTSDQIANLARRLSEAEAALLAALDGNDESMADPDGRSSLLRKMLERLRESEADLAAVQKVVHCGSWEIDLVTPTDLNLCPTRWSDELFRIFGYEPGRVPPTNHGALEIIHPQDRPILARALSELVHERIAYHIVFRIIRGDGTERVVQECAEFSNGSGTPRLVGRVQDVTDRNRTEQSRRHSEERFARIFRASPLAMACSELGPGGFIDVNDRWLELFGYERHEMIGWTDCDRGLWADSAEQDRLVARLEAEERVRNFECRVRRKSGEIRVALLSVENLQSGREPMRLMIVNDITERIEREKALRMHSHVLASMAEGVHVVDESGVILFNNPAADVMFGYSSGGLVGQHVAALMDLPAAESRAYVERIIRDAISTGSWWGEIPNRKRDGTPFLSRVRVSSIEIGGKTCLVSVREDVTETKRLEAQLLRAQRMESLGRLASGVAHDLNNILAPIMMVSPLLRAETSEEEKEKLLATVETSAERGAHLVRQLLYFGRGVDGQRSLLRLKDSVHEIEELISETFPRNIIVEAKVANDTWPVHADGTQIHQVLLNLCVNARDAMMEGGKLEIAVANAPGGPNHDTAPGLPAGRYVRIIVSDTGTGIPPEYLSKIWDPFFTTKEPGKGTGLGLATVLGIVKAHGGCVDVQSEPGHGTQFRVYLPAESLATIVDAPVAAKAPPLGQNETILLVEDEAAIRELTQTILQHHGYNVIVATNGNEGLALFKEYADEISLIVTDFDMPEMDGLSLVGNVREITPDMKVIVSSGVRSGLESEEGVARLRACGISTILAKPYTPGSILAAVHNILAPSRLDNA